MKLLIASDIHGSATYAEQLLNRLEAERADRLILLGDVLYHGPRNDLPDGYAPKSVIAMLNPLKDRIWAVRGNCEAEVDQMVLQFPVMADYAILALNGHTIFATHGHLFDETKLPPLMEGDALLHGHTHLLKAEKLTAEDGRTFFHLNPGSTSLPKGGNPNTYAILDEDMFTVYDFDDHTIASISLNA